MLEGHGERLATKESHATQQVAALSFEESDAPFPYEEALFHHFPKTHQKAPLPLPLHLGLETL